MEYLELDTNRWQAEMMLIAGMLSTLPAIINNSLLFPEFLAFVGIDSFDPYSIGELLILAVSAPVGEEIFKALFVLSLYRIIDSPRRGFQVGFSVGLGFAMLENLQYILASLFGGEYAAITYGMTTLVRGIGSIPGHAFWTGISGCAIGWQLSQSRHGEKNSLHSDTTNWMLIDASSGQALPKREQEDRGIIQRWLDIPADKAWVLPKSPILALLWAITAHSLWNGSSWYVSYLFRDSDLMTNLLAIIIWTVLLISMLWFVGRHILASVKHLPDGKYIAPR
jgi:RsiW-degrading membrane proteinase PrsW (M82 family)